MVRIASFYSPLNTARTAAGEARTRRRPLREGQEHIVSQLELTRRELREDIRDVRAHVVAIQNGQFAFATAPVAGLLGVIATLIVKL